MPSKFAVGAVTVAASMALAAAPALAQTVPVNLSFNHLVLDTPVTGDAQVVTPKTAPVRATAQVDPTTGAFTIDPSTFSVPTYSFTSPTPGTATLSLASQASGTVDFATGAVTMTADFLTTINTALTGSCTLNTGTLTLTTSATKPLPGIRFPAGPTGVATGDGAFGAAWSTLPPGTGPGCAEIDSFVAGPGGIWVSRGITPAQAIASVTPKLALHAARSHPVRAGQTATVKVTLTNSGAAATKAVKVCLSARKGLAPMHSCKLVKAPAAKSHHTLVFKLKTTTRTRAGLYRLTVSAAGAKPAKVALKVLKK
ncbi:hypothetical protein [Conexibacter sp. DBS9H8]|uniref:hypothetical protein n=1 Tax=Conexibacter sp. DBS9H8 TaxID=2937801 RepID=UPI00200BDB52|nr:hypothetical protein [Conexibacter sp. DBS9H8]